MDVDFSRIVIVAASITLLVVGGFYTAQASDDKTEFLRDGDEKRNVVIISIDPLRSDHMPCYGYHRNTTPNICSVAEDSYAFENAYSTSTWTLPSTGSVFSSNYPSVHGATHKERNNFHPVGPTLAGFLQRRGYATAAFVGEGFVGSRFGLDKGFNVYKELITRTKSPEVPGLHFNATIPKSLNWIDKTEEPFFLYLQSFDPHAPYASPEPFRGHYSSNYSGVLTNYTLDYRRKKGNILDDIYQTKNGPVLRTEKKTIQLNERDLQYIVDRYDEGLRYSDYMLGKYLQSLRDRGLMNETVVIIQSAHGETIADRRNRGRRIVGRFGPYEEIVNVPLIVRIPENEGREISGRVSLLDMMPTIVSGLGVENETLSNTMQGKSFAKVFRGGSVNRETLFFEYHLHNLVGVSTERWKFIQKPGFQNKLYNLDRDPGEKNDIINERPQTVSRLQSKIDRWKLKNNRFKERYR